MQNSTELYSHADTNSIASLLDMHAVFCKHITTMCMHGEDHSLHLHPNNNKKPINITLMAAECR